MRNRLLMAIPAAAAAIALGAGPALAHECYIASRSWQGNLMAGTHSQAWFLVNLNEELASDVEAGNLTQDQASCILNELTASGVPLEFTIHVKGANGLDGVLAANNPNDWLMANGTGVDHFFDVYGGALFSSFDKCGVPFQE